jgi:anti-anti-sigma factor
VQIEEHAFGDVVVLDLHGKMTAGDDTVQTRIQALVDGGARYVLLNFSDVSYMDSVGLSTLVRSHMKLCQNGGRLALLHLPKRIVDLMTASRLITVIEAFDDEAAAIRRIKRSAAV